MSHSHGPLLLAALGLAVVLGACGSHLGTQPPALAPPLPAAPLGIRSSLAPVLLDPITALLADASVAYAAGERELALGHLDRARAAFDRALDVLLESPEDVRTAPQLLRYYGWLVERISTYEVAALARGDGFTEQPAVAASIDELLALATFEHTTVPPSLGETVVSDLQRTPHDIPIPANDRVLAYVDLFQGRLHDWFKAALERAGRYLPMITAVFRAENLPFDLAYVPLIESAYQPAALSRAKAKGVWQFVLRTARSHGLRTNWYVDERADPEKATAAAAKYLKALQEQFSGDWHLALASYNGGPGLVQRAITRTKLTDFWSLAQRPRLLPRETREYVPMILASIIVARNPLQYGFQVDFHEPLQYERVVVSHPVDLRRVAEWTGVSVDQIRELNPELRRMITPLWEPAYELKVPRGTADTVRARLAEATPDELATLQWHVVRKGETLATIANRLRVRRVDLAEANNLSPQARLVAGQRLVVPVSPSVLLDARPAGARASAPARPAETAQLPVPARVSTADPQRRTVYTVKPGDTLYAIAKDFGVTVNELMSWNSLTSSRIRPGDRLTVLSRGPTVPRP